MDGTLIQIVNEWLAAQNVAQRLERENADLKAQIAELQKPKAEVVDAPVNGAVSQPLIDTQVVAEHSA